MQTIDVIAAGADTLSRMDTTPLHAGAETLRLSVTETGRVSSPHGVLGLSHFFLLILGVLVAATARASQHWFAIHRASMVLAALTSIACLVTGLLGGSSAFSSGAHGIIGVLYTLLAGIVQPILGYLADAWFNPRRRRTPGFPDKTHVYHGWLLMLLMLTTFYTGLSHGQSGLLFYILVTFPVGILVMVAVMEKRHENKLRRKMLMKARKSGMSSSYTSGHRHRKGSTSTVGSSTTGRSRNGSVGDTLGGTLGGTGAGKSRSIVVNYFGDRVPMTIALQEEPETLIAQFAEAFQDLEAEIIGIYRHGDVVLPIQHLGSIKLFRRIEKGEEYYLALKPIEPASQYGFSSTLAKINSFMVGRNAPVDHAEVERAAKEKKKQQAGKSGEAMATELAHEDKPLDPYTSSVYRTGADGSRVYGSSASNLPVHDLTRVRLRDLFISDASYRFDKGKVKDDKKDKKDKSKSSSGKNSSGSRSKSHKRRRKHSSK